MSACFEGLFRLGDQRVLVTECLPGVAGVSRAPARKPKAAAAATCLQADSKLSGVVAVRDARARAKLDPTDAEAAEERHGAPRWHVVSWLCLLAFLSTVGSFNAVPPSDLELHVLPVDVEGAVADRGGLGPDEAVVLAEPARQQLIGTEPLLPVVVPGGWQPPKEPGAAAIQSGVWHPALGCRLLVSADASQILEEADAVSEDAADEMQAPVLRSAPNHRWLGLDSFVSELLPLEEEEALDSLLRSWRGQWLEQTQDMALFGLFSIALFFRALARARLEHHHLWHAQAVA